MQKLDAKNEKTANPSGYSLCTDVPPPSEKIGRRDVCESMSLIVFRLHLHKLSFFCFFL